MHDVFHVRPCSLKPDPITHRYGHFYESLHGPVLQKSKDTKVSLTGRNTFKHLYISDYFFYSKITLIIIWINNYQTQVMQLSDASNVVGNVVMLLNSYTNFKLFSK